MKSHLYSRFPAPKRMSGPGNGKNDAKATLLGLVLPEGQAGGGEALRVRMAAAPNLVLTAVLRNRALFRAGDHCLAHYLCRLLGCYSFLLLKTAPQSCFHTKSWGQLSPEVFYVDSVARITPTNTQCLCAC